MQCARGKTQTSQSGHCNAIWPAPPLHVLMERMDGLGVIFPCSFCRVNISCRRCCLEAEGDSGRRWKDGIMSMQSWAEGEHFPIQWGAKQSLSAQLYNRVRYVRTDPQPPGDPHC